MEPTQAQRQQVCMMVACDMNVRTIATAMNMPSAELKRLFAIELRDGAALFKGELMVMLRKSADQGNVAAMKQLERMARVTKPLPRRPGKKEYKAQEAVQAMRASDWSVKLAQ